MKNKEKENNTQNLQWFGVNEPTSTLYIIDYALKANTTMISLNISAV